LQKYIDSIFKDLGLQSRRKSNFIAEIFSPYRPDNFNGFVDEYLQNRDRRLVRSDGHVDGKAEEGNGKIQVNGKACTNGDAHKLGTLDA
jgi:hypothetical protein